MRLKEGVLALLPATGLEAEARSPDFSRDRRVCLGLAPRLFWIFLTGLLETRLGGLWDVVVFLACFLGLLESELVDFLLCWLLASRRLVCLTVPTCLFMAGLSLVV